MNMERSIFEKEPTKVENKNGEKTIIENPDIAQEYYSTALKLSDKEKIGEELTETDYDKLEEVLETIRSNRLFEKLDINWEELSKEELLEIYHKAEDIVAEHNEFMVEKLEPLVRNLSLSMMIVVMLLIFMADIPGKIRQLDDLVNAKGEVVSLSKFIQSSFHY